MIGAIAGDIIGSVYEGNPIKSTDFQLFWPISRFTDDTVLTVATGYAILNGLDYGQAYKSFGLMYPNAGYGGTFLRWLFNPESKPYGSWGNGSAMRVSPIGWAFQTVEEVLEQAKLSSIVSHDHPEGIKGAQAVALAVFMARTGSDKDSIRSEISSRFGYNLERTIDMIRPTYIFDVSCQGSVPEAIIAFLESVDYESAIRLAISLGGDSDTLACIAGAIADAFYRKIPGDIVAEAKARLSKHLLEVVEQFEKDYNIRPT
ncbi:MAG: ADP-ribosylglycohydrolase family protein [Acidobacteriota bacterium]|nr:ADP-ribosylglycohydrolase family protein [Blastocatellia bacterium]MDW8411803.1 ADP-ribosylglycohydrolase family protein [Acidobacteriota bacterium]